MNKILNIISILFFSFMGSITNAQSIKLLTEPLDNRINNIVIYGEVTGDIIPNKISLKINQDVFTVEVNDIGLFMQPYTLIEGNNYVAVALTETDLIAPVDTQTLKFINYKLPSVVIDGNINGSMVNLNAIGNSPVESQLTYIWEESKQNPTSLNLSSYSGTNTSFTIPETPGEYLIYCKATDNEGRTFKAGRLLNKSNRKAFLNTPSSHANWIDSIMIYEYQIFRHKYEDLPFERMIEKFDHIKKLGATTIWHTPPILGGGGNYFANDFYLIDPEYGTNDDYRRFVEKAHEAGLKVIFDLGIGHTNSNHYFLNNVYTLKDQSPYKDYYYWDGEPGNSQVKFSPDNGSNVIYANVGNDEFKEYLLRVLEYWIIEYDIDGYRYDCGQEIFNRDNYFLQEAQIKLRNIKPDVALFIEGNYIENPEYLSVADICYDWQLHGWGTLNGFKGVFEQNISIDQFHNDFMQSFADSTLPLRYCNTGYFDPVHQTYDKEREKTGHIIAFTGYGSSLIYAGTETGSSSGPISWEEDLSMYPFMRKLVEVKKNILGNYPLLQRLTNNASEKVYSYLSKNGENRIIVVSNLSPDAQNITIDLDVNKINTLSTYHFKDLINNTELMVLQSQLANVNVSLNAWETKMFWIGENTINIDKKVESIIIENNDFSINTHQGQIKLNYEVLPKDALDKRVVWSVDNEELATISQEGILRATGINNGIIEITVSPLDEYGIKTTIKVNIYNQEYYHNCIANPGFDDLLDFWNITHYSGIYDLNFDNGHTNFIINKQGVNSWDIALAQPYITLDPNTEYYFSFEVKSSVLQHIKCQLSSMYEPYVGIIWHEFEVNDQWETKTYNFSTPSELSELNLSFFMGNNIGDISFDNFVLKKKYETTKVNVTFQVNMKEETVSPSGIFLRGSFNNWTSAEAIETNGTIHYITKELTPGETIEYKFVNGEQWEESIGNDCTIEGNNRYIVVPETDTIIEAVCFNSCLACETQIKTITFQVDMRDENVSPEGVSIKGNWDNWQTPIYLNIVEGTDIYNCSVDFYDLAADSIIQYKFANGYSWESLTGECTITEGEYTNRYLYAPEANITLDAVCFNSCLACETQIKTITFQVDMRNENVSPEGVSIKGNWDNWQTPIYLNIVEGTDIYNCSVDFYDLAADSIIQYKFANGYSWESLTGECTITEGEYTNRYLYAPETNITLDAACFNSCSSCSSLALYQIDTNYMQVYPNPVQGILYIDSQMKGDSFIEIIDLNGKTVITRLMKTISGRVNLTSISRGVYYIRITNDEHSITKKIIVE